MDYENEKNESIYDFSVPDDQPMYEASEEGDVSAYEDFSNYVGTPLTILRKYANEGCDFKIHIDSGILSESVEVDKDVLVMYPSGVIENVKPQQDHMVETIKQLKIIEDSIGIFEKVLDFGSGVKRRYCADFHIVCHVDLHQDNGECACGAQNKMIFDKVCPEYETFLAINSLQNNKAFDQREIFEKLRILGVRVVIVQPRILNHDETDVRVEFIKNYPTGKIYNYLHGEIFVYDPESDIKILESICDIDTEINITSSGYPAKRTEKSLRSVVLVASEDKIPIVVRHKDGRAVDFLVAGHVKYGETPKQALDREIKEEMVDKEYNYEFVGVIEPMDNDWQVFVYHTTDVRRPCGSFVRPERERGYLVKLEYTMYTRDAFPRVLLMCVGAGLVEYDVNLLYISNLKKRVPNRRKWSAFGQEKISEYFKIHKNRGIPTIYLGSIVRTGEIIKCWGPKIDLIQPEKVDLYSGGVQVGVGSRVGNNLYKADIKVEVPHERLWCNSEVVPLVVPVTGQCAKLMSTLFGWKFTDMMDYLILKEGKVSIMDMKSQNHGVKCAIQESTDKVAPYKGPSTKVTIPKGNLKFIFDKVAEGGEKELIVVKKENKKKKKSGIFSLGINNDI